MKRKFFWILTGLGLMGFFGWFLFGKINTEFRIRAQEASESAEVATPTISMDETGMYPERSAERRRPMRLKNKVKAAYGIKDEVEVELTNIDANSVEVQLTDEKNKEVKVEYGQNDSGGETILTVTPPPQLTPGKYELKITDQTGYVITQDFLWGVLAINPNKAIYNPSEKANLAMAVLDEAGEMVCGARLVLIVTNPEGEVTELSTDNGKIVVNPECQTKKVTIKPDYETVYTTTKIGHYSMELTAENDNGDHVIRDSFEVKENIDYEVERISATRIYPLNVYPMTIKITANKDFAGNIYEEVPKSFEVTEPEAGAEKYVSVNEEDEVKKITWKVEMKKGEKISLGYRYKAREISPQFYLTGPLKLATLTDLVYEEGRRWQIAADSTMTIRQEINIIAGAVTAGGTDAALINIDTTKYNNATYYFEVVASQGAGTTLTVFLNTGATNTVGIGITNGTTIVRTRKVFTPETGSFDYRLNVTTGSTHTIKAARVIIIQSAASITDTETQVEVGNLETGKTMATSALYTAPAFQAVGTSFASTGAGGTVSWPANYEVDDVALLFIETVGNTTPTLSMPNGFVPVTNSPQSVGTTQTGTTLSIFWARADSLFMQNPLLATANNHQFAVMVTYRGCVKTGNPWDVTAGSTKGSASTTTVFDSVTTTVNNALIVLAAARANDNAAAAWSAEANPNLTNIAERHDYGTASGNGGGLLVTDGLQASAGVGGTSSATVTSSVNSQITIALKGMPVPAVDALASPKYWTYTAANWETGTTFYAETTWKKNDTTIQPPSLVGKGLFALSTGDLGLTFPTGYQDGDVFFLFVESANQTISVSDGGWTEVANSPQGTGTAGSAGGVRLAVFYKFVSGVQATGVVITDSGNHTSGIVLNFRGVNTTSPVNISAGKTDASITASMSWPSVDTTNDNTLVLFAAGLDKDLADVDTITVGWTGVSLTNLHEVADETSATATGGGVAVGVGVKESAGTVGNVAATADTSTTHAYLTIAINGILADTTPEMTLTLQEDNGSFSGWSDKIDIGSSLVTSGVVTRTRSAKFTPTDGRHYRLVRTLQKSVYGSTFDIYNAKIIADQTNAGGISKFEAQYLLLNTSSTTIGSTLGFYNYWDSTEWAGVENVYRHAVDSIGVGTSAQLVDVDNGSTQVTGSKINGVGQTISGNLTMPTTGHRLDTWLLGSGEVDASRILVAMVPAAPTIIVSGWCKKYDTTTNCADGETVRYAVGGTLMPATTTISGGTWVFTGQTIPAANSVVTVYLSGVGVSLRANTVTKYASGDLTGVYLYENMLTIGHSGGAISIGNSAMAAYDNSAAGTGTSEVFFEVDVGNTLNTDVVGQFSEQKVYVYPGNEFRPGSAGSNNILAKTVMIGGTLTADANTIYVAGSWDNNAQFIKGTSTVIFNATTGTKTVDSTGAVTSDFNNLQTLNGLTLQLDTGTTIAGALTVGAGTTLVTGASVTMAVGGTASISGTMANSGTGGKIYGSMLIINSGGSFNNANNSNISFLGGLTNNSAGTVSFGTGTMTFETNDQTISGTNSITIPRLTANATHVHNGLSGSAGLTVSIALSGVGTLVQNSNANLYLGGGYSVLVLDTYTNSGNTVYYTGFSQAVRTVDYENLTLNGSGIPTISGTMTVSGTLTVTGIGVTNNGNLTVTTALSGSGGLTQAVGSTLNLGGSSGITTLTATNDANTVNYIGTSAQNIKATTYHDLNVKPAGNNVTTVLGTAGGQTLMVQGDLVLGNGSNTAVVVEASTYDPNISVSGNVTVAGNTNFTNSDLSTATLNIDGNLAINAGSPAKGTFFAPIGKTATTFTLAGNFTNNGTFSHHSGQITFDGGGHTTQTITGDATFYKLTATTTADNNRVLKFAGGSTTTIDTGGTLTVTGADCDSFMVLRSVTAGSQWNLVNNGVAAVSFVDVQDSNLTGTGITASDSVDAGNNNDAKWTIAANACLGASTQTNATATGYSFQRKTFYDSANSTYWQFYGDGNYVQSRYSTNTSIWNVDDAVSVLNYPTNDFSVWYQQIGATEFVYLAVKSGYDIVVRSGQLSASGINWDTTETLFFDGTSTSDTYMYPVITADSPASGNPHIWVTATHLTGTDYVIKARDTVNTAEVDPDATPWTFNVATQISDTQTGSNAFSNIVPLLSGDMYATLVGGTAVEGCKWDDNDGSGRWENTAGTESCATVSGTGGDTTYFDSLSTGLVGYWKMNEASWNGTAGEVVDETANNLDGTRYGEANTTSAGFWRSGIFDNNADYVGVTDPGTSPLDITGELTISAWIYKTSDTATGSWDDLVAKGDTDSEPANYWMQIIDVGDTEYLDFFYSAGGELRGSTPILLNTWYHVAVTYDDAANSIKLYVNGDLGGTTVVFTDPLNNSLTTNDYPLRMGNTYGGQDFGGKMDEVRIYDRALTGEEINKLYQLVPDKVNIDDASDFSSLPGSGRQVVRTKSGTLYAWLNDSNNCEMWKSTDGVLWVQQQPGTSILCSESSAAASDTNQDIHVVYSNNDDLNYRKYDTATDAWEVSEEPIYTESRGVNSNLIVSVAISVDASDIPHVVYTGYYSENGGNDEYWDVQYKNRIGGTWGAWLTISSASMGIVKSGVDISIDMDNKPEVSYTVDGSGLYTARGSANNPANFSDNTQVDSTINGAGINTALAVDTLTGNTWVAYQDSGGTVSLAKHAYGDSWSTWSTITTKTDVGYEPSIAIADNSDIYVFYQDDSTDQKIVYDVYSAGAASPAWSGAETVLQTPSSGGDFSDVKAKWAFEWNNYGANRIDYLFSDGADVFWDYLYIRRQPTNIDDASDFDDPGDSGRMVVRDSNGYLYSFVNDSGNCELWKSTDAGNTWTLKDNVTCVTNEGIGAAVDSNDDVHCVYTQGTADIKYSLYDSSAGSFGDEGSVYTETGTSPGTGKAAIAIDSNDKPHVTMQTNNTVEAMITTYIKYSNKISGSWKAPVGVDSSINGLSGNSITVDEDNIPLIVFALTSGDDISIRAYGGNQNNATSFNSKTVDDTAQSYIPSVAVDSDGNTYVAYVDEDGTDDYVTLAKRADGDETSSWSTGWTTDITDSKVGTNPSIATEGTDVYVFYEDDQDDVVYDKYVGSSWSGETLLEEHGALQDVKARWSYINNYDSTGTARVQTNTYYFDNSDNCAAGATCQDPQSVWTDDSLAFNTSLEDDAYTNTSGDSSTNYLKAEGTSVQEEGGTITSVKVKVIGTYADTGGCSLYTSVYSDGGGTLLGTVLLPSGISDNMEVLDVPSGGWTWSKIQGLEVKNYVFNDNNCTGILAQLKIVQIIVESTNTTAQNEIDYLYSDGTDVFYNRLALGEAGVVGVQDTIASLAGTISDNISIVSDSSGYVHLAYIDESNYVKYKEYTTDWQTAVSLDTNAGNSAVTIAKRASNNDLYAFWIRNNKIYYKKGVSTYASGNWDAGVTILNETGTNASLTSGYTDGGNKIVTTWTRGSETPYSLVYGSVTISAAAGPSVDQLMRHGQWFNNGAKQPVTF